MTLIIIRSILKYKKYDKDKIITDYMNWAHIPGSKFMGKNTRELFATTKTLRGYKIHYDKQFKKDQKTWTQSNGALMRCSGLAFLPGNDFIIDTKISNPHPINIECETIYIYILRSLLCGFDIKTIFTRIKKMSKYTEVSKIIQDVVDNKKRDISINKGWVINAFYISLYALYYLNDDIIKMYDYVIGKNMGGDTDTNGAISGAIVGMKLGLKKMLKNPVFSFNLNKVMTTDTTKGNYVRGKEYHPSDYKILARGLLDLLLNRCKIKSL